MPEPQPRESTPTDFDLRLRGEITAEEYVRRLTERARERIREQEMHYRSHPDRRRFWRKKGRP